MLARSEIRLGSESLDAGDRVRVTGTVRPLSTIEVERELGWDLDPQLEIEFKGRQDLVIVRVCAGGADDADRTVIDVVAYSGAGSGCPRS